MKQAAPLLALLLLLACQAAAASDAQLDELTEAEVNRAAAGGGNGQDKSATPAPVTVYEYTTSRLGRPANDHEHDVVKVGTTGPTTSGEVTTDADDDEVGRPTDNVVHGITDDELRTKSNPAKVRRVRIRKKTDSREQSINQEDAGSPQSEDTVGKAPDVEDAADSEQAGQAYNEGLIDVVLNEVRDEYLKVGAALPEEKRSAAEAEDKQALFDQWVTDLRYHSRTIPTTQLPEEATEATVVQAEVAADEPPAVEGSGGGDDDNNDDLLEQWVSDIKENSGKDDVDSRGADKGVGVLLTERIDDDDYGDEVAGPPREVRLADAEAVDDDGSVHVDVSFRLTFDPDIFRAGEELERGDRQAGGGEERRRRRRQKAKLEARAGKLSQKLRLEDESLLRMSLDKGDPELVGAAIKRGRPENLKVAFTESDPDLLTMVFQHSTMKLLETLVQNAKEDNIKVFLTGLSIDKQEE